MMYQLKSLSWWKWVCIILLGYTLVAGLTLPVPAREILNETIRNLYFHVPMWFAMIALCLWSFVYSILYLGNYNYKYDAQARAFAEVGFVMGIAGLLTGMLWAKYTWGDWWSQDIKQITSAITLLIYAALFVLRGSIEDEKKGATISAVYNIFAFVLIFPLLFIIPRLQDSLHPGNGGNPALGDDSLAPMMRPIFYPAVIAWILLGFWIANIKYRYFIYKNALENEES